MGPFEYRYRQFKNSKLATFVDKHTHKPSSCVLLTLAVIALVLVPLAALARFLPENGVISAVFALLTIVLVIVGPVVGGFVIPKLSDRFDWAGKIALAQTKKSTQRTK